MRLLILFVLMIGFVRSLIFDMVITGFQQGAHDRRPFIHWTDPRTVPGAAIVVIQIGFLIQTNVHHVPFVIQADSAVIDNAYHAAIIINRRTLGVTVIPRGH